MYLCLPAGLYGHPRAEPEPAGVLPLCLLQDRLQPAGLQSLDRHRHHHPHHHYNHQLNFFECSLTDVT